MKTSASLPKSFFILVIFISTLFCDKTYSQLLSFSLTNNMQCFSSSVTNTTSAVITSTVAGTASYSWTINGFGLCTPTYTNVSGGSQINITFPCCGSYTISCSALSSSSAVLASFNNVYQSICSPTVTASSSSSSSCAGSALTLTAGGGAQSYTWNSSITGSLIVVSPTVSTTYTVVGSNMFGCTSSETIALNVIEPVLPDFTFSYLPNGQVSFLNTSTNTSTSTSYFWNFGNGITSTAPQTVATMYTINGTYTVALTAISSCGTYSTSKTISVTNMSLCAPSFTYSSDANGNYTFTNTSANTSSTTIYYWDFGNSVTYSATGASTVLLPVQTYTTGVYVVSLYMKSLTPSCDSTVTQAINVCMLAADFNTVQVSGTSVSFSSTSSGTTSLTSYLWDYGDGNSGSGSSGIHTYTAGGTYPVTLFLNSAMNCTTSASKVITVAPCNPQADFTHTVEANGVVKYTSIPVNAGSATKYFWNFGDGIYSLAENPTHVYSNAGTHLVTLRIQDSLNPLCKDSLTQSINITGISCSANSYFTIVPGYTAQYWNAYPAYPYNIISAVWDWGDGTQSNTLYASHQYSAAAHYPVCLTVTVFCGTSSSYCHSYFMNKLVEADNSSAIISINVLAPELSTGVNEIEKNMFAYTVYPNPANGEFKIQLNDQTTEKVKIEILNLVGQAVYICEEAEIPVQEVRMDVPEGVYFVRVSCGEQSRIKKIIITR